MTPFSASLLLIVLAEMGDKTQLLAMAFAARYKASQVLWAVFLATALNHTLAVIAGKLLTKIIPFEIISLITALSFIFFGLWTLRGETLDTKNQKKSKFGPIATVAIAFFLAEMADKTQLATISLAIEYNDMLAVLLGSTTGMVIADAIGIFIGSVLKKHLPDKQVKWLSACVFILFGLTATYKSLSGKLTVIHALIIMIAAGLVIVICAYNLLKNSRRQVPN